MSIILLFIGVFLMLTAIQQYKRKKAIQKEMVQHIKRNQSIYGINLDK